MDTKRLPLSLCKISIAPAGPTFSQLEFPSNFLISRHLSDIFKKVKILSDAWYEPKQVACKWLVLQEEPPAVKGKARSKAIRLKVKQGQALSHSNENHSHFDVKIELKGLFTNSINNWIMLNTITLKALTRSRLPSLHSSSNLRPQVRQTLNEVFNRHID